MTDARDIVGQSPEEFSKAIVHLQEELQKTLDDAASLRKQLEDARSEALEEAAAFVAEYSKTQCGEGMVISAMRDSAKAFARDIRALKGKS